jgi:membrane-associated phospholipid phosphatase
MTHQFFYFAELLNNDLNFYIFAAILVAIAMLVAPKNRIPLLMALLISTSSLALIKNYFHEDRPCFTAPPVQAGVECPKDYGFPSGHTQTSFIIAFGAIGSLAFPIFLFVAMAVSYSRILLNVHTLTQIGGGIALGLLIFFACHEANEELKKRFKNWKKFDDWAVNFNPLKPKF